MSGSTTGSNGGRPMVMSGRAVVTSGHYLATQAGLEILGRGGNAADAAAAVGFALTVVQPYQNGIGGEVPTLVYSAGDRNVSAVSGHGTAPGAATLERFLSLGLEIIPGDGFLPAVVPPAPASWILLLERFGTMRLGEVIAPAIRLAQEGFPIYDSLRTAIETNAERFRKEWPSSAEVFMPGGKVGATGSLLRNPDWAKTFGRLVRAEAKAKGRKSGLQAARDEFYKGFAAKRIVRFVQGTAIKDASGRAHKGLLTLEDFAGYKAKVEEAVSTVYKGVKVHKCSSWTQGPVMLQALNLVGKFDVAKMGHNTAAYIHTLVECMKLAYADREFYYGDPDFVKVPFGRLLSKRYAAERARLVDGKRASMELRPGGMKAVRAEDILGVNAAFGGDGYDNDTTKLEVIDSAGNMVSATPSGGWLQSSPVVPGLGFPLGTRGQMFSLVAGHPNCIEPGKRPRSTLTPTLATKGGRGYMAFGSPGGDAQDQWALQFFLNVVEFGMSLQEAVEAPTFWSEHWPSSFYPRKAAPGVLQVEARISAGVRRELSARGHKVKVAAAWGGGNTHAASMDHATGVRAAAASPRMEAAYAGGL